MVLFILHGFFFGIFRQLLPPSGDMEHFKKVAWAYKTFIAKRPFIRVIEMKQRQQNPQQADRKDWSQWEEPVTVNEEQIVAWRQQLAKNSKKESMQYK